MIGRPLRRAYLSALAGVVVLLLALQFATRSISPQPPASPGSSLLGAVPAVAAPPLPALDDFHAWRERFEAASAGERAALLDRGRPLAEAHRDAFLELMRADPSAALAQAPSLTALAALPDELRPYFPHPISGVGSVDLRWRTDLDADGSFRCRHEHVLHLDGETWEAVGPALTAPTPPRADVPVSGIALGTLAVLAPSAVRLLTPEEDAAATKLFPLGNPDGLDPVTGGTATARNSALIGGKVFRFEAPSIVDHVAETLLVAEREAREENRFAIEHHFEWLAASGGGGDGSEAPVDETPFMEDTIDVLFIRVDFSDLPGEPVSQTDLETTLAAVAGHLEDYSYNAATIVPTVTPTVYRMPATGASYAVAGDNEGIQDDARALASVDFTIDDYDVIAVFFPDLGDVTDSVITYGGLASIGGSNHWINGTNSTNVILHEFGHNYGLYHANYWDETQTLPGEYDVPFSREYGDIFDLMGSGLAPEGHFNHFHKNRLEWMPDSKVAEATGDGTFRIYRFDHLNALANPTLALKVPMGGDVYYWVGYRQLYTSSTYNLATGAYIVAEGLSQNAETNLIDATPGSASPESDDREDCGLEVGVPFVDSGVTFLAVDRGGEAPNEWIDVSVSFESRVGLVATAVEIDEQAGLAWLTLRRQFSSVGPAAVDFATADDSATAPADYHSTAGTVTWADGDSGDKTIAIPIRPDTLAEGIESLIVTLSNPADATLDAAASSATVSILDPGVRCTSFAPAFFNNSVYAIAPLPNGQVLIGGAINHTSGDFANVFNLARLDPDGSVDATLDTGSGFDARVRAIAVQSDGRILVGGEFTSYDGSPCNKLIRLNPDGLIDTNIGGVDDGNVYALAIESDGKILVGGDFSSFDGTPAEAMIRLTASGARDTDNPLALPFVTGWNSEVHDIDVEADGKLMVVGTFYNTDGSGFKSGVARLEADGSRDESFHPGDGAHALGATTSLRRIYAIARQVDGKYVIGGRFTAFDSNAASRLARLDNDGSFDSSFVPPQFDDDVRVLALQPGGRILVGGSFLVGGPYLAALHGDGSDDGSFAIGTGPGGTVLSIAQAPGGGVYVGGNFFLFNGLTSRPVVKLAGGAAPYDFWVLDHFTAAQIAAGEADPAADPDDDGSSNAAERALGTDPNLFNGDHIFGPGSAGTYSLHESGGEFYLEVSVEKGSGSSGAWFVAQFADRSMTWAPAPSLPGSNPVYHILEDSPTRFAIRDKTPLGTDSRFVRIGVRHPE